MADSLLRRYIDNLKGSCYICVSEGLWLDMCSTIFRNANAEDMAIADFIWKRKKVIVNERNAKDRSEIADGDLDWECQ